MNTIKRIGLVSAVAFALFTFNACGDDSNSTSAPGENSALSSAVEDDESSSSVIPDPDRESSSSSRMSSSATTENLDKSSSSVVIPCSSSSVILSGGSAGVEGSSSSSAKSSSSENSSSSKNQSSSSSVKQSSSSSNLVQSSSSKGNPWGTSAEWGPFNCKANGGCLEFTDDRNGRVYKYLKFDGKKCLNFNEKGKCTDDKDTSIYAMVENLNIGKMVDGSLDQNVDNEIERYCYDNDTLICHYYGGLYQWAEMMGFNDSCNTKSCAHLIQENHQGICPDKWRLLTYEDFYIILNSNENKHGIEGLRSSFGCDGYNGTGFSLVCGGENWGYAYDNFDEAVYWFYPEETDSNLLKASGSYTGLSMTTVRKGSYKKTHGFSVRCVKAE